MGHYDSGQCKFTMLANENFYVTGAANSLFGVLYLKEEDNIS